MFLRDRKKRFLGSIISMRRLRTSYAWLQEMYRVKKERFSKNISAPSKVISPRVEPGASLPAGHHLSEQCQFNSDGIKVVRTEPKNLADPAASNTWQEIFHKNVEYREKDTVKYLCLHNAILLRRWRFSWFYAGFLEKTTTQVGLLDRKISVYSRDPLVDQNKLPRV